MPEGSPDWAAWPTESKALTQEFGANVDRYRDRFGLPNGHNGIDIAATEGAPVYAAAAGVVAYTGLDAAGYGNHAIIDHAGGWSSLYGHLSRIDVKRDQALAAGDLIGPAGDTGYSDGPHLHFEIRDPAGQAVDPWPLLQPLIVKWPGGDPAGWVYYPSVVATAGYAGPYGLNLRQAPISGALKLGLIEAGAPFEIIGPPVAGYVPIRLKA